MGRTACTEPQCLYKGALYLFTCIPLFHGKNGNSNAPQRYVISASPVLLVRPAYLRLFCNWHLDRSVIMETYKEMKELTLHNRAYIGLLRQHIPV